MCKKFFWFDLDNTPHVPFFNPIFKELTRRHIEFFVTSRKFAQTEDLLNFWQIPHQLIGVHAGKNKTKKLINLILRSSQLRKRLAGQEEILAVSHGSRTQLVASWQMGIKSILIMDYEFTESIIFNYLSSIILIPKYIPEQRLRSCGFNLKKVIRYNGFKEELYLNSFIPNLGFRNSIGVLDDQILIVVRPPSLDCHYHDARSENLLIGAINYFAEGKNNIVLIVNRTDSEKRFILSKTTGNPNIRFLEKAVDGLQLLFAADISISGGGTMNREAALLGTKAYSIFTGKRPYLDGYLQELGKLKFIEQVDEIKDIPIQRFNKTIPNFNNNLVNEITDIIVNYHK